jgi:hypothetical protein
VLGVGASLPARLDIALSGPPAGTGVSMIVLLIREAVPIHRLEGVRDANDEI